jgi:DNA-directed RNA polymerase subunit M/transcription elongation factor TFIIS
MNVIDNIIEYFKQPQEETQGKAPKGICPSCWGYQEYENKFRKLYKDKQIDVNNHQDHYMFVQKFVVKNIDGIRLKEAEIKYVCPNCGQEVSEHEPHSHE